MDKAEFRASVENLYQKAMGGQISWHEFNTRLEEAQKGFGAISCLCGTLYFRTIMGNVTMYYVYRLASAGPESELVWKCPRCGRVLDIGTTRDVIQVGDRIRVTTGMNEGCVGTVEKIKDTFYNEPYWVNLDEKGLFLYRRDRITRNET